MVGVFGFYLLLGGEENGGSAAYHQGRVFARVLGGFILLLAMVPFQTPRGLKQTDPPEKL